MANIDLPNTGTNEAEKIIARLRDEYPHYVAYDEQFAAQIAALPASVDTKADHDRYVQLMTDMRGRSRDVESTRVSEKEPYLNAGRAVDGFFTPIVTGLDKAVRALNLKVTGYLRRIEEEERQARLKALREEQEKAEIARLEREKAEREAADKRRKESARKEAEERADRAAREEQEREQAADVARRQAEASAADLARQRTDQGRLSTLKTVWTFAVDDWDVIPLDKLRTLIKRQEIERAIKQYVANGGRELAGVRIYQEKQGVVR